MAMLYPSIDELKKKADSRYTLVMLASKRARDLIDGYPPLVDAYDHEKPVSIATEEIAEDQITYSRKFTTEEEAEELAEEEIIRELDREEGISVPEEEAAPAEEAAGSEEDSGEAGGSPEATDAAETEETTEETEEASDSAGDE